MSSLKTVVIDIVKLAVLIGVAHLYILICSLAYKKLEGVDTPLNETLEVFLTKLHAGELSAENTSEVIQKYQQIKQAEDHWKERHEFNSIPKSFVYTLSAHTTLGNRRMNIKTQNAQLFYIMTVPLGVLLYYVMIHFIALRFLNLIEETCMLVWRKEDDNLNDRQRNLFIRLKLSGAMIFYTLFLLFCLSLASLLQPHTFVTELVYIVDIFLTISSSENFVLYNLSHDDADAFITTITYFVCTLFAYSTSFSIWSVFYTYSVEEIFLFVTGDKSVYENLNKECDDKIKDQSMWEAYYMSSNNVTVFSRHKELTATSVTKELGIDKIMSL